MKSALGPFAVTQTGDQKKNAQCENCELSFIWGLTEDYSPGDSISDSSEELLRRLRGGSQYI